MPSLPSLNVILYDLKVVGAVQDLSVEAAKGVAPSLLFLSFIPILSQLKPKLNKVASATAMAGTYFVSRQLVLL